MVFSRFFARACPGARPAATAVQAPTAASISVASLCVALGCALIPATASAAPVNVANLFGTASANAVYSVHSASNAVDNDNSTLWIAPGHGTPSAPNWLLVDLGTNFLVTSVDLFWQESDGLYAGFTNEFSMFYGPDGSDWTLIGSGTFVDESGPIAASFAVPDPGQAMRFVKYEVNGGSHWSGLAEMRVWAEVPVVDPVPEPATLALLGLGLVALRVSRRRRG